MFSEIASSHVTLFIVDTYSSEKDMMLCRLNAVEQDYNEHILK